MHTRREIDGPEDVARLRDMHARQEVREARMAWLDDQDATFRALVHEIGLNAACKKDGRRPPT
jgi:hypothetical protein